MLEIYKFGVASVVTAADTIVHSAHETVGINPFPASHGQLSVVSSSVEDAAGGSGASGISISGLKLFGSIYRRADFDVTISGTDSVIVAGWSQAFRVHRAFVIMGSTNVGVITLTIGSTPVAEIPVGIGQTETATETTGTNEHAYVRSIFANMIAGVGTTPKAIIKWWIKPCGGPWRVFLTPVVITPAGGQVVHVFPSHGPIIPTLHDTKSEVFAFTGTSADIVAGMDLGVWQAKIPES